jgi:hypothetical protein
MINPNPLRFINKLASFRNDELVLDMCNLARRNPDSFARRLWAAMEHFISGKRCRVTLERMPRAIIIAAEQTGEDGRGKDRLGGYLRRLARDFPRSFIPLLELACGSPLPWQEPEVLDPGPSLDEMVPRYTRIFFNRS